jgi:hypothetical protein
VKPEKRFLSKEHRKAKITEPERPCQLTFLCEYFSINARSTKTIMKLVTAFQTLTGFAALSLIAAISSCTPYQQQGAAIGGLGGAALGGIAGDDGGDVVRGAAIGAAAGTGIAAYRENQANNRNNYDRYNDYDSNNSPNSSPYSPSPNNSPAREIPSRPTPPPPQNQNYPQALPGVNANTVVSPYPPYNSLDGTGYRSGQKVCDPSTIPINPATGNQYIDPATGQPDVSRGKYFIVP